MKIEFDSGLVVHLNDQHRLKKMLDHARRDKCLEREFYVLKRLQETERNIAAHLTTLQVI